MLRLEGLHSVGLQTAAGSGLHASPFGCSLPEGGGQSAEGPSCCLLQMRCPLVLFGFLISERPKIVHAWQGSVVLGLKVVSILDKREEAAQMTWPGIERHFGS